MPRVSFHTLGCKLNFAETSTIARDFEDHQFEIVPFGMPADVTVINTCSVTAEADRKCRQSIRRARKISPHAFLIVTGCYAQLDPEAISTIPGVDAVLGTAQKFAIFDLLDFEKTERTQIAVSCIDDVSAFGPAVSSGERTRAFLKVQDGCDYNCSFCTIPLARGRSRSQPTEAVVAQAHQLAESGYREVVLSGVNIGLFGLDTEENLLELLSALDRVDGIHRFRISSIEPNLLTDAIIDFVAQSRAFQPHFHIPLQSGDDAVLGAMRRRYRRDVYTGRAERIMRVMPHACIGADVIVGFPAEDEDRFQNTCRFIADLPISYLHVFTYSERANTVAVDAPERIGDTIPKSERSRRNRRLRHLSNLKQRAFYQAHAGSVRHVLWERIGDEGVMFGFTDNYVRVSRPADALLPGVIQPVRLGAPAADGTLTVAA